MITYENNSTHLLKDLLSGDESILNREDFKNLDFQELKEGLDLIRNNPHLNQNNIQQLLDNSWKINYIEKPPTIEEFLTEHWIGPTANNIYSHVKEVLIKFYNSTNPYRSLYLSPAIGWGKSTTVAIVILFTLVNAYLLRNYKKYYNVAETSTVVAALGAFTLKKAKQLLLKKIKNILITSPKFRRTKYEEKLIPFEEEERKNQNKIVWTTASTMESEIQFAKDLHILCVSDPGSIIGLDILVGALTETSFWIENGISPEEINRMMNDLEDRIYSRFSQEYYARFILDSSPNDFSNPIDKYVFSGEAEKDPKNLVVTSSHWELKDFEWKYPEWQKTGKSFYIFRGSAGKPTFEINEDQIDSFHPDEIMKVPVDLHNRYIKNSEKIVKDYGGWPSSGQDKLISNYKLIDEIFDINLKNIEYAIKAPANKSPKRLIWDQIVDSFFIKINDRYKFYRNPHEVHYIHIDQSESGDVTGIACGHVELTKTGEYIYIIDFTICVVPDKNRINLDAISEFIYDLRNLGHLKIGLVTFDMWQSAPTIQRFKRDGFECKKFSVDSDMNPYLLLVSRIKDGKLKLGRNIFVKNNLKSIYETTTEKGKKKIDHLKGKIVNEYNGDWKNALTGTHAKDISDCIAAVVYHCINEFQGVPRNIYNPKIVESEDEMLLKIEKQYGLIPKT